MGSAHRAFAAREYALARVRLIASYPENSGWRIVRNAGPNDLFSFGAIISAVAHWLQNPNPPAHAGPERTALEYRGD
jgi:hypothetical protein